MSKSHYTKEKLYQVTNFIKKHSFNNDYLYAVSLLLYTKLKREIDGQTVLLPFTLDNIFVGSTSNNKSDEKSFRKMIEEALYRLEQGEVELLGNVKTVIQFIDELFENDRYDLIIPRWLGDFMVKLLKSHASDKVVDLFSRAGVVTSSAFLNGISDVSSYYTNERFVYWLKIQQLLLTKREQELEFMPSLLRGEITLLREASADVVFLTPPFNLKLNIEADSNLSHLGIKDSASIFLNSALRLAKPGGKVLIIVPDGYLFSKRYKKARKYFKNRFYIESIISLPEGTFKPRTNIRTSLIVIRKEKTIRGDKCLMSSVAESPEKYLIDSMENASLKEVLSKINDFRKGSQVEPSMSGFLVDDLDASNFHFSKYWYENYYNKPENLEKGYLSIPLKELALKIERGGNLVADKEGGIPFIGPANIRTMNLRKDHPVFTSENKLPNRIRRIKVGQIVINTIGNHRGSAALVSSEFEGLPFNRHVVSILPNTKIINAGYLAVVLNSSFVQEQFFDKSVGATILSLNLKSFEEIFIPVPDLDLQESIYNEFLALTEKMDQVRNKLSDLESRFKSKLEYLGKEGTEE